MNRTMAMHVRYKYFYVSLPPFAHQQREMTKATRIQQDTFDPILFLSGFTPRLLCTEMSSEHAP